MKNSANRTDEISENKTQKEEPPREISPKPETVNLTILEPSMDTASKTEIQTEIQSLFRIHPEFDWTWLDPLFDEIPDKTLHLETARRLFALGKTNAPFDRLRFAKMLRTTNVRALHQAKVNARASC